MTFQPLDIAAFIGFLALVDSMREDPALKVVNAARISYEKRKAEFQGE